MLWIPVVGPDEKLLRDLAARFPKPSEPLGEAWFMGETRYLYDELNAGGIEAVDDEYLRDAFDEMLGGMSSFYEMDVWAQWYAYLTPRILLSGLSDAETFPVAMSDLWDGLISLSWYSHATDVRRYEADFARVLATLIMHQSCWRSGRYHDPRLGDKSVSSWDTHSSPYFATSMMLSWRYLHPSALEPWLHSVLAIEDPQWRAQFLLWGQQVAPIFARKNSTWEVLKELDIESLWAGSCRWMPSRDLWPERRTLELIPRHNIAALRAAITRYFDETTYLAWIDTFAAQPEIWPQIELALENLPQVLAELRG